jgi:PilZ domain
MTTLRGTHMEHRWGERFEVILPVRIHAAGSVIGTGLVTNFSVSGAFIASTVPVSLLSRVTISFQFGRHPVRLRSGSSVFIAQVVRHGSAGFGVEWCEFGSEDVVAFANANIRYRQVETHLESAHQ